MFSIGFMTWGAEGVLLRGLARYGTVGTGLVRVRVRVRRVRVQVRVRVRYGYGTGTVRGRYGILSTSKNANRALLLKLANCNFPISSAFAAVTKHEVPIIYQGVFSDLHSGLRAGSAHMSWEFWQIPGTKAPNSCGYSS